MTDPFEQASRAEHDRTRRRRQRALRSSLRIHAAVFAFIQVLLIVVWAMTGAGFAWFVFPLLGWGAGLAAHAVVVRESAALAIDDESSGHAR
jgi:fatty acid desaturase